MPFTPFHLGPGLALKALGGERFSLIGFGLVQVAMDMEPFLGLINDWPVLHGWTHSLLGATAIGVLVGLLTPRLGQPLLRIWNDRWRDEGLPGFAAGERPGRNAALAGALLGGWAHVALDAVMHADLHPFWPWSEARPLLHLLSLSALHRACVAAGAAGAAVWLWRGWRRQRRLAQQAAVPRRAAAKPADFGGGHKGS
ncbi:metal-dependent hydrolase [Tahibacter harae]|uniref:DUF4184 family protein n=1 Tax=Tahibacter harae TaxID=2963937 RepID=A0ABT1QYP6_9GAMM|nr:metal-dependent hydrolase [Tahibacter harae]MCQ4167406.1 DUF4184 family protein [Tahibacter harae]